MENFHFLRPLWLLLLPLVAWLIYRLAKGGDHASLWRKVCDPALLERFLVGQHTKQQRWPWWLLLAATVTGLVALAGPVWQQVEQPLYRQQQALVIVLDLSRSMLAADIKPDRLTRAKQKLSDLLALRHEGQTALVVYAGDAFVITPLTDDVRVIAQQEPVLAPDMMPAQGSRLDLALKQALQLFKNSGVAHGEVLLLTDSAEHGKAMAADLHQRGHRVSVLGFGSADGAPIVGASGFVTDGSGNIVVARTDWSALRRLAQAGGGWFARATLDDADLQQLAAVLAPSHAMDNNKKSLGLGDQWHEEGAWLMLLLLPLAALAFRRGWVLAAVLVVGCLSQPEPVAALDFSNWWRNGDQQAKVLLDQGEAKQAASQFKDARWKATAHYRAGDYAQAAKELADRDDAESDYNRGNALAKSGRLEQALAAYDQALKKKPNMKDAAFNRGLVQKLKQQQKKKQQQKDKDSQKKSGDKKGDKKSDQQQKSGDKGKKKSASPKQGGEQRQKQQSSAERQSSTEQQAKNRDGKKGAAGDKSKQDQQAKVANKKKEDAKGDEKRSSASRLDPKSELKNEQKQAQQQWLRRIPDDPGGLLRRKFQYQYRQRGDHQQEEKTW